ncbi:MAG TPA: aconitate hydratase [Candidatus Scatomorpha intestinigallinarum]|uniref:Aconitate hydratase n=1 Tax=Candidatus Scatomorpha intestinigallinarum TaxID=2840923 RepID=A0A9D1IZF5_9FIRM|nr:aconitate hydratase [Candidatus Scatomorpha intestinigallinarum]
MNAAQKLISAHLVSGDLTPGGEIAIKIDQTLTQDSTGTMAYLQLEAMGTEQVKTRRSVAYIDHNMLQSGFENADDHKYIQTVAAKHGIWFSRPGNGICHQVHLERFSVPGQTLLGSDSHTPTCGAAGMLAIGAGGLDVAVAMGGGAYYLAMPKICKVELTGALRPMVTAKDVILEVLRRLSVKGGVGKIMEYSGEGLKTLSVPERATIANMGAELGATTTVFPSDEVTRAFFKAQGREDDWSELMPDPDAEYDEEISIDLSALHPLAAMPHSPDNVAPVSEKAGIKIDQVAIGSCTNSSYADMMKVAAILDGHTVAPNVSLVISPGSRQVLTMLASNGALAKMVAAGARVLECACGPCIGMGQAPATDAVSLRTFNRNFCGRSGTASASVWLVSPETAAVSAITGVLTDPETWAPVEKPALPERFAADDSMVLAPAADPDAVEVVRGPNIKPFPKAQAPAETIEGKVLIKLGDNITTDHIMPSNAKLLPYRSNVPYLSEFCLTPCDAGFPARAKENGGGFIVAGQNYGQGSSREHAALAPLYLGVKGVVALGFARIHRANLINNGILPLCLENEADYAALSEGDEITIDRVHEQIAAAARGEGVTLRCGDREIKVRMTITPRQRDILLAGGLLNYTREQAGKEEA